jgi:hypothetical protein
MEMIGLPIKEEEQYRRLENFYHSWCSQCQDFKPGCVILDCPKLGKVSI